MKRITSGYGTTVGERDLAARLRRMNLDLLPVLHELLRTRSVTRTARAFNMTQPAVSRALRQLRAAFDDQLLVAPGRNARLSDRAQALAGPLGRTLAELDLLLKPAGPFDPASEAVHLVINTADYVMQLLAPILSEMCAREAPHVVLEFTWISTRRAEDLAQVDFMIGPRAFGETLGKRVGSLPLWRDEMVCIAAARNRTIPERLTPVQFQASRYVAFRRELRMPQEMRTQLQPTSPLEIAPVCTAPNFLVLGAIVEKSDCVALVPRKVARELMRAARLRIVEIAYPRKQLFIDAYWSPATDGRRGRAWFRGLLTRAAARLA
ncbi:MAG: LysR family transcriptional regulator [Alphaproteobacteria bacterium]|nr:LysR family transcriptional regulator [Alphaproteobacteria bacterium]MCW5741059.1 LysR family transcriptional regulator [Alphaproteobacteria bacterium]